MPSYPIELTELAGLATGVSNEYPVNNFQIVGLMVHFSTGLSAGVVSLQSAGEAGYIGEWLNNGDVGLPVVLPGANGLAVQVIGNRVRVKVTTNLSGGTIVKAFLYLG